MSDCLCKIHVLYRYDLNITIILLLVVVISNPSLNDENIHVAELLKTEVRRTQNVKVTC